MVLSERMGGHVLGGWEGWSQFHALPIFLRGGVVMQREVWQLNLGWWSYHWVVAFTVSVQKHVITRGGPCVPPWWCDLYIPLSSGIEINAPLARVLERTQSNLLTAWIKDPHLTLDLGRLPRAEKWMCTDWSREDLIADRRGGKNHLEKICDTSPRLPWQRKTQSAE